MGKLHVTKNKVKVYSYDMPHLHGFHLTLNLRAGDIYENIPGITHFLEHVVQRGVEDLFEKDETNEIRKYGFYLNASTYTNRMQFEISGNSKFFRQACRIFANHLDMNALTPQAFRIEKERICREVEEDFLPSDIFQLSTDTVWEDTSLANHRTAEALAKITLSQLKAEWKKCFTAKNMFFYITGAIPAEDLEYFYGLIEAYPVNFGGNERKNIVAVPPNFMKRNINIYAMPVSTHTIISFNFDFDTAKYNIYEINFLDNYLFSGSDSLLYNRLSTKKGLIYEGSGGIWCYNNAGNINYRYEVASEELIESVKIVIETLSGIKTEIFDNDFEGVMIDFVENTHKVVDNIENMNYEMMENHIFSYDNIDYSQLVERYRAISKERLMQMAREIFAPDNITIVLKWEKKPNLKEIRKIVAGI